MKKQGEEVDRLKQQLAEQTKAHAHELRDLQKKLDESVRLDK